MSGSLVASIARNPVGSAAGLVVAAAWIAIAVNALWLQSGPHPSPYFNRDRLAEAPAVPVPKPERRVTAVDPGKAVDDQAQRAAERRAAMTRDLQGELKRRNYYQGPVDGRFGPRTQAAIHAYEQAAGLEATGEPSDVLLAHVRLSTLSAPPVPVPSPLRSAPEAGPTADVEPVEPQITGALEPAVAQPRDPLADLIVESEAPPADEVAPIPVKTFPITLPPRPEKGAPQSAPAAGPPTADPRIEAVQTILADLGYGPGSIDGRLSAETRRAIEDFEVDRGLPMTGRISRQLLNELSAVSGVPLS